MSYDNTNRGQIWKNDRKETENHPDFTGTLNVEGKEYFVSAWKRNPDANPKAPALSFSVREKDLNAGQATRQAAQGQTEPDFDDSIPF